MMERDHCPHSGADEVESGPSQVRTCRQGQPIQGLAGHDQEFWLRNSDPLKGCKQYSPRIRTSTLGAIVFILQSIRNYRKTKVALLNRDCIWFHKHVISIHFVPSTVQSTEDAYKWDSIFALEKFTDQWGGSHINQWLRCRALWWSFKAQKFSPYDSFLEWMCLNRGFKGGLKLSWQRRSRGRIGVLAGGMVWLRKPQSMAKWGGSSGPIDRVLVKDMGRPAAPRWTSLTSVILEPPKI